MINISIKEGKMILAEAKLIKIEDEKIIYVEKFTSFKKGAGSRLIKKVNQFIEKQNMQGILYNQIPETDKAHSIYINNGWGEMNNGGEYKIISSDEESKILSKFPMLKYTPKPR